MSLMAPCRSLLLALPAVVAFPSMQDGTVGSLDPNRILCPVLAALHKSGDLVVDEFGDAERGAIKHALKEGTYCEEDLAEFQSAGIAGYDMTHKFDQLERNRCLPGLTWSGSACFAKWLVGSNAADVKRYLNIFKMNGLETVEHGISTGVRGGNCNGLLSNDPCNGVYPCEALFQKFYVSKADVNGRLYIEQILQIICHAAMEGDRGGEFAYQDGEVTVLGLDVAKLPARTWQMRAAMHGWLSAFGRPDEAGTLYLTVDDARAMIMEGRVPDNWEKRKWGCITKLGGCPKMFNGVRDLSLIGQMKTEMPCEEFGEWWRGTSDNFQTTTGATCSRDSQCESSDQHSLCLGGRCTCSKGRDGLQMIFANGRCNEQNAPRQYFGEQCNFVRANAPESPWTWPIASTSNVTLV